MASDETVEQIIAEVEKNKLLYDVREPDPKKKSDVWKEIAQHVGFPSGSLEAYHSTMLKFAPKRLHFHYASMKGRMQLAVLDHNYNTGREQASTKEGKKRFSFVASKMQGGEWTAKRVLKEKSHGYAVEMMADVLKSGAKTHQCHTMMRTLRSQYQKSQRTLLNVLAPPPPQLKS